MKVSRRGLYALKALIHLAEAYDHGLVRRATSPPTRTCPRSSWRGYCSRSRTRASSLPSAAARAAIGSVAAPGGLHRRRRAPDRRASGTVRGRRRVAAAGAHGAAPRRPLRPLSRSPQRSGRHRGPYEPRGPRGEKPSRARGAARGGARVNRLAGDSCNQMSSKYVDLRGRLGALVARALDALSSAPSRSRPRRPRRAHRAPREAPPRRRGPASTGQPEAKPREPSDRPQPRRFRHRRWGDVSMRGNRRWAAGASALALWTVAASARAEEPKKPAEPAKLTAGAEGFVLQSASGDFRLQLRGYVHFDGRFFPSDDGQARARHLPAEAGAADLRGDARPPLRVPDHAGLRWRRDRASGRLSRRELLAEGAPPRRQVQVAGRARAAAVGHGALVRRARLPDRPRAEPRRGRDAPRRAGRGGRRVCRRCLRRRSRRRQRRPRPQRRQGRGRPPVPVPVQARELAPRRASASGSRAPRASSRAPCPATARVVR